jgi:hypothetical protein
MTQVFKRYPRGGGEFTLALAIADYAWDDGTNIFPGVGKLATKSRQSERAVQGHLRVMVACGWLSVVKSAQGGRSRTTEYRISTDWLKGAELAPFNDDEKGAIRAPKRVQIDVRKGAKRDIAYKGIHHNRHLEPPPLPPDGGASGFETVAAGYPRRAGIEAARRVWDELAPNVQLQAEIARAIRAWIPSDEWQRKGGQYIPSFGKFLRDRRWLDAPGTAEPRSLPAMPPARVMTPAELAANKARAAEAVARIKGLGKAVPA